ncbi:MAG: fibronectin type III domain-containing protein, partial [Planctomycetes bacterium]|nr:fibronectin type III domain-containing protein [Planctomycetota bacterium]
MGRKLFLLAIIMMLTVGITAQFARAADIVENFVDSGGVIDIRSSGNETPRTQSTSGLTWGGYSAYTGTNTSSTVDRVRIDGGIDALKFDGRPIRSSGGDGGGAEGCYAYTVFTSTHLTGGMIKIMAANNETADDRAWTVSAMIEKDGVWYVSVETQFVDDIVDNTPQLYTWDLSDPITWQPATPEVGNAMDAVTGGDESALSLGTAVTLPDYRSITGGGIYSRTRANTNSQVRVTSIVWEVDPSVSQPPTVDAGGNETAHLVPYPPAGTEGVDWWLPGPVFRPGEDPVGWENLQGATVSDPEGDTLTYEWSAIAYTGTDAPDEPNALAAVYFTTPDKHALDPNAVFGYLGEYTLQLEVDDGNGNIVTDTLTQTVLENIPPVVQGSPEEGSLGRTIYQTDVLGPYASGMVKPRNASPHLPMQPYKLKINDDDYPLTNRDNYMHWRVLSKPAGSTVTFTHGSGASKRVSTDEYWGIADTWGGRANLPDTYADDSEDPNVTFSHQGQYRISLDAWDSEFHADPNRVATFTIIDNMEAEITAGEDIYIDTKKNPGLAPGSATTQLDGEIIFDDPDEYVNKIPLEINWRYDSGPGTVTFDNINDVDTTAEFSAPGEYLLRLQVKDGNDDGIDDYDVNDIVMVTVYSQPVDVLILTPEDDTYVRDGTRSNYTYGRSYNLRTTRGDGNLTYIKFDMKGFVGNIYEATLELEADGGIDQNSVVYAVSGSDWDEGTGDGFATDTGLTYDNKELVRGDLLDRIEEDWSTQDRKKFDVTNMFIESYDKVTFELDLESRRDGSTSVENFRSKENDNNGVPIPGNGAVLIVVYDPNQAYNPYPAEDALGVTPFPTLTWKIGTSDSADVNFGPKGSMTYHTTVNHGSDPNGTFTPTGPLTFGTTYQWQINGSNGSIGEIWEFTILMVNTAPVVTISPNPFEDVYLKFDNPLRSVGSDADKAQVEADGGKVHIVASATDIDQYPDPVTYKWSRLSGPGTATFTPDNDPNTLIDLSEAGTYEILLQAFDGEDEANDILVINSIWEPLEEITLDEPSDDTQVRDGGSYDDENYGIRPILQIRNGDVGTGRYRRAFLKFDLSSIPGNIEKARLSIVSAEWQNNADTLIYATTYGPSGEWFEGTDNGVEDPYTGIGLTHNTTDLVRRDELDRWEITSGNWNNDVRKEFDVSDMDIETDGTVTLELFVDYDGTKDFHSKEEVEVPDYRPKLIVVYDPNIAYAPGIPDGREDVYLRPTLSWKSPSGAGTNYVYFGTSEATMSLIWSGAVSGSKSLYLPSYYGSDLALDTTYYWRVVNSISGGDGEGAIWTFTTYDSNIPPTVDAGGPHSTYTKRGGKVYASATTGDLDSYPDPVTVTWKLYSGPEPANIVSPNSKNTLITVSRPGTYEFLCTAFDGESDANDIMIVNATKEPLPFMVFTPSDDAGIHGGTGNDPDNNVRNYGAEPVLMTRNGSGNQNWRSYVKFDLKSIVGNARQASLSIVAAENIDNGDATVWSTTYGESGEWFEGDGMMDTNDLFVDTTGVGITHSPADDRPQRVVELDRLDNSINWLNGERKTFDVSGMAIESDQKVTLEIRTTQDNDRQDFHSKESLVPDTIPILTVYYDPNQAYLPGPYNNETDVSPLDMPLTWKTNVKVENNYVYFGTSVADLTHKVTIATDTDPNMSWMPDVALAAEAEYFWRIDTDSSEGQVWRFTVKSNDPPTVDAGNNRIAYTKDGGKIVLDGSVTDDMLPDWGTTTSTWYVESTPDGASVTFDPPDASDPTAEATFDLLGEYVLRLQAGDGEMDANDLMEVLVLERPLAQDSRLPTDDAYVNNQNDTNRDRNYGAGGDLNVRSGNNTRLSYLKFDLSDVVGNIRLATLALNPREDMDDTQVSAVTYGSGEWFEGTGPASGTDPNDYSGVGITWNSDDLVWGSQLDEVLGIVADTTYEFDVTDMAIESDGKATFGLTTSRDDGVYSWRSKEVDNENRWPVLTVIYDPNQAYRLGNLGGPRNGEIEVHPRPDAFTWKAGGDTTFNRFYFGTDENNLIQLGPVLAASP